MFEYLTSLKTVVDKLSIREKSLVMLTGLALLYVLMYENGVAIQQKKIDARNSGIVKLAQKNQIYKQEYNNLTQGFKQAIQRKTQQLSKLDNKLKKLKLMDRDYPTVKKLLTELLSDFKGLELISLETLSATPVIDAVALRKQPYRIRFQGTFPEVLNYLTEIKESAPMLHWESFAYQVTKFPVANIDMTFYIYELNKPNQAQVSP